MDKFWILYCRWQFGLPEGDRETHDIAAALPESPERRILRVPFLKVLQSHCPEIHPRGRDRRVPEDARQSVDVPAVTDVAHREAAVTERVRVDPSHAPRAAPRLVSNCVAQIDEGDGAGIRKRPPTPCPHSLPLQQGRVSLSVPSPTREGEGSFADRCKGVAD